jgi:hypothetical protein
MNLRKKWILDNKDKLHVGGRYTKTTLFLLPILGVYYKDFMYDKSYLVNCFISNNLDNSEIILILHNEEYEPIISLVQRLTCNSLFSESWTDNDDKETVLSFDLKKNWNIDFKRFVRGRYSLFSAELKEKLIKCYGTLSAPDHKASVYDAIVPSKQKKEALSEFLGTDIKELPNGEVLDIPRLEIEQYYTYKNLEELYGVRQMDK